MLKLLTGGIVIALLFGGPLLAHPNHRILGTASTVSAEHLVVKDREGKAHTIKLVKTTKVTRNKRAIKVSDIPAGARVVVTVVSDEDLTAKTIEVGVVAGGTR